MQLTRYSDYALRVLLYLAIKGETRSTISEIAESYDISRNHLMKVVQDLSHRGYVTTIRGKNGGLLINRAPEDISLGRLIRDTESELGLVECLRENNQCPITAACRARSILNEALDAFLAVLDRYTLADLLGRRQPQLARLMQIAISPV